MAKKAIKSKTTKSAAINIEFARIWQAADGVATCDEDNAFDPATKARLVTFIESAIELASTSLVAPHEDLTDLLQRAQLGLGSAIRSMPVIQDYFDPSPPSTKEIKTWQVRLVRDAVRILRSFSSAPEAAAAGTVAPPLDYEPYEFKLAADLDDPDPSKLWMVEHLWQRSAAGIIGGGAKGCKTWLALDIALSVASGTRVLDRFDVHQPGGVLYVNAEGGEAYVKDRLNALCLHRGLKLDSLPHELRVIPNAIRIDTPDGIGRLKATLEALAPTLLVLDPLVRLHRGDENSASTVSNLLSSLSELQQSFDLSLILVHHSTKQGARRAEMNGQDFRGSGDFHAWGSSNIAIRKKGNNRFVVSA